MVCPYIGIMFLEECYYGCTWALKGLVWTGTESGICPLVFIHIKENALDIHFSHSTTDQQLEKSELEPKLARLSNKNFIVPICCSTLGT